MKNDETVSSFGADPCDLAELIEDIEKSFGISFDKYPDNSILTVGQLNDVVAAELQLRDGPRQACLTAKAFLKLRAALREMALYSNVRPSTRLTDIMPGSIRGRLEFWRTFQSTSGLHLPVLAVGLQWRFPWLARVPMDTCRTLGDAARMAVALNFKSLVEPAGTYHRADLWAAITILCQTYFGQGKRRIVRDTQFN